jgi:hypothetical protein
MFLGDLGANFEKLSELSSEDLMLFFSTLNDIELKKGCFVSDFKVGELNEIMSLFFLELEK